jgi:hypothetical protein
MARTTTSFRLDDELRQKLQELAKSEGLSVNALVERTLREGLEVNEHPGIIFVTGPAGRRASVVAAPDVWEIISTWRWLEGSEEERMSTLIEDYALTEWQVNVALDYAAANREEIDNWIAENDRAYEEYQRLQAERQRLIS